MFKKSKNKNNIKLSKQKLALLIITPLAILAIILVIVDIYNRQQKIEEEIIDEEILVDEERDEEEIIVPDPDTELTEQEREVIAVPERVASSNPSSGTMSQRRSFSFNLENNNLINTGDSGMEINVYRYDSLTLSFTAIDKDYNISIPDFFGSTIDIKAGETVTRRFQATNIGSFPYYCEICGGVDSPASGVINVFERE